MTKQANHFICGDGDDDGCVACGGDGADNTVGMGTHTDTTAGMDTHTGSTGNTDRGVGRFQE